MDKNNPLTKNIRKSSFDFAVLGAGLAGLTIAYRLVNSGKSVIILDTKNIGGGASGTSVGLMNPASAQKALPDSDCRLYVEAFYELVDEVSPHAESPFILRDAVFRPAVDNTLEENFRKSANSGKWPENWCVWTEDEYVRELYPFISGRGGLMVNCGCSVNVPAYLNAIFEASRLSGLDFVWASNFKIRKHSSGYEFLDDGKTFMASKVIDCTGYSQVLQNPDLRLHAVKGQTMTIKSPLLPNIPHAISAYGYFSPDENGNLVAGSTYEHHFRSVEPDENGSKLLKEKLRKLFSTGLNEYEIINRWAGVRTTTFDRKPGIGPLKRDQDYIFFTGLGSKGLYFSAYLSKVLCDYLISGKPIPHKFDIRRLVRN